MKTYQIEICETLCRVVDVQAESPSNAVDIVENRYSDGDIVLDASDYQDYTIKAL